MNIKGFPVLLLLIIHFAVLGQVEHASEPAVPSNKELFDAIFDGDNAKVEELLNKKANPNVYSQNGISPLIYAVNRNDSTMVHLLLEHKADPNTRANNTKKEFPLLVACERGFGSIADLLIRYGADVNLANYYEITPLHFASFYNDSAILTKLLVKGANVNTASTFGETPLLYAAFNGSLFAAIGLLEYGANPNIPDKQGFTPLMVASQNGHTEVVFELISSSADINLQNKMGFSGLSYAIIHKQHETADLLLLNGANKNEQNTMSLNPMALARIFNNKPALDSLRKVGAKRNLLPTFKYAGTIGFDMRVNDKDFLTGFVFSQIDIKYGFEYSVFYFLRPFAVPVLQEVASNTFYQYWERRHIIGISLAKRFRIFQRGSSSLLVFGEGLYEYHFGRYRGTTINNKGGLLLSPGIGVIYVNKKLDFRLAGQYTNYSVTGLPNWYIGCGIRWNIEIKFGGGKNIHLIDYK